MKQSKKWAKTLQKLYYSVVIALLFDTDLPTDQRERFEKVVAKIDPELYGNVYLPYMNGISEPLAVRLFEARKLYQKKIMEIFNESDRKLLMTEKEKRPERYNNLTQTAKVLEVPRQTMYYWIKKKWVKPKRDYKNYPVFTVDDIKAMIIWRDEIKFEKIQRKRTVRLYDKANCL